MKVLLVEPYYGGSHKAWADGYQQASCHEIKLLTLPAQFWKWRMQGGAVTLARQFQQLRTRPEVILASDMMNLATFRALTRDVTTSIPTALYLHENQLSYPQNTRQGHGWRYGFINYTSALAADAIADEKNDVAEDIEAVLSDVEEDIDELSEEVEEASGESKEEINQALDELEQKKSKLETQLQKINTTTRYISSI